MVATNQHAPIPIALDRLQADFAIGGAAQSGIVFVVALVALLSLDLVAGNIRPKVR